MQQGPVRLRSFGKRRYSVQRRLDWTDSVWRHVGFTEGIRAPGAEPVIALLGGIERDRPERAYAGKSQTPPTLAPSLTQNLPCDR
ncbi:hypothetical protein HPB48_014603 [Haemaphysalis longicornis]|uniref:Uncharacterized protein n=1 Tax=Haemaphysalis longicornis TaxID=44386 RepID=A0A9J6H0W7_HAELO|nr:hypothetical protein HPB48_014603 [Haemaphysalis longicornis]